MNKIYSYSNLLLLLVVLCNCKSETNEARDYTAIEKDTDWESKNLRGKVKSIAVHKATYLNTDGAKTREPILTFTEKFTEFGSTKMTEYYDNFGNLSQTTTNEFDANEFFIKSLTIDELRPYQSLMTIKYDTIRSVVVRSVVLNDSLNFKTIEEYDENEQLIRQTNIEKGDTIVWIAIQKYDENNRLIFKELFPSNDESPQMFSYKYDQRGNIIESINGTEWMKFKSISVYDGNTLRQRTDYVVSADTKERLTEITLFDKYSNPTNLKIYEDSELNREFNYKYVYDGIGNWIEKVVFFKEHYANSKNFTPAHIEKREIEYW